MSHKSSLGGGGGQSNCQGGKFPVAVFSGTALDSRVDIYLHKIGSAVLNIPEWWKIIGAILEEDIFAPS